MKLSSVFAAFGLMLGLAAPAAHAAIVPKIKVAADAAGRALLVLVHPLVPIHLNVGGRFPRGGQQAGPVRGRLLAARLFLLFLTARRALALVLLLLLGQGEDDVAGGRRHLGGGGVDAAAQDEVELEGVRARVGALAGAAEGDGAMAGPVAAQLDVRVLDVL